MKDLVLKNLEIIIFKAMKLELIIICMLKFFLVLFITPIILSAFASRRLLYDIIIRINFISSLPFLLPEREKKKEKRQMEKKGLIYMDVFMILGCHQVFNDPV